MERQSAAECLEVRGTGRATADQGRTRSMRESGGAVKTTVPGGTERARSQGGADWFMGRGRVMGMEV